MPWRSSLPGVALGAFAVDERGLAVHDDAVVAVGLLDEPPLAGRIVPDPLLGRAVEGLGVVDDDVGRRPLGQEAAALQAGGHGRVGESRQWASSSDMISCSRTQ